MIESNRIEYIDTSKGIAVLLVIIGHIYHMLPIPVGAMIASLHNPTFYAASGMLLAAGSSDFKDKSNALLVMIKKFINLVIPFGLWSVIYAGILYFSWEGVFIDWLADAMNKLWFLPVLFTAVFVIIILERFAMKSRYVIMFGLCGILFGAFVSSAIAKFCTYILIVYLGYIAYHLDEKEKNRFSKTALGIWGILLLSYSCITAVYTGNAADTVGLLIHLFCSLAGGISLIFLLGKFNDSMNRNIKNGLSYIGQNSLYFYILHFIAVYFLELSSDQSMVTYVFAIAAAIIIPVIVHVLIKNTVVEKVLF